MDTHHIALCCICSFFPQYGPVNQAQLAEACFVVSVLDSKVKKDLLSWFVKLQLSEYLVLFAEDQEVRTFNSSFVKGALL